MLIIIIVATSRHLCPANDQKQKSKVEIHPTNTWGSLKYHISPWHAVLQDNFISLWAFSSFLLSFVISKDGNKLLFVSFSMLSEHQISSCWRGFFSILCSNVYALFSVTFVGCIIMMWRKYLDMTRIRFKEKYVSVVNY